MSQVGLTPRERLLQGAMEHVAANGVADLSLRGLAQALGTSHRMLSYHFGSREGLLIEVIKAVEEQQREALAQMLEEEAGQPSAETMRRMWRRLADPSLWPNERLFFEIYGQALQGRPGTTELLDGIVENWLEPATEINMAQGMDRDTARAVGRLGIAVTRGLLLDLLATGDREGVDEAVEAWIALNERAGG
jgi:AcrR family transcriptional regulator